MTRTLRQRSRRLRLRKIKFLPPNLPLSAIHSFRNNGMSHVKCAVLANIMKERITNSIHGNTEMITDLTIDNSAHLTNTTVHVAIK